MEQMTLTGPPGAVRTRADQIYDRWATFHLANPIVYRVFKQFADEKRRRHSTYGARIIYGMVRYELPLLLVETDEPVKLNDHYSAYYARLYNLERNCDFFEIRHRTSEDVPAHKTDLVFHHTGPAGDEESLNRKLRQLLEKTLHPVNHDLPNSKEPDDET